MPAEHHQTAAAAIAGQMTATEPLLRRLIVAPVLFVSFLISLVIIDRQTYGGIFGRVPPSASNKDGYYHSHQRKLAKQEMDEAWRMRRRVIVALCFVSAVALAVVAWGIESVWTVWRVRAHGSVG